MAFPVQSIQGLAWQNYTSNATDLICPFALDFTTYSEYDIRPSGIYGAQGNRTAAGLVVDNILNPVPVVVTIGPLVETIPPFTKQTIQLTSGSPLVKFVAQPCKCRVSFYAGNYAGSLAGTNFYAAQLAAGLAVETGMVYMFAGSLASIPTGYLLADGTAVSRSQYPGLFAIIGTLYGTGDGSTTFNLPNLCGRVALGAGSSGGRTPRALAGSGGLETVSLAVSQVPPLTVSVNDPGHTHAIADPGHAHVLAQTAHSHAVSETDHNHTLFQNTHTHGLTDPGHAHLMYSQGANGYAGRNFYHTSLLSGRNVPDNFSPQGGVMGVSGQPDAYSFNAGYIDTSIAGNGTGASVAGQVANIGINAARTNLSVQAANANVTCNAVGTGIANYNSVTGITATTSGGNGAHENMPPWLGLQFVVKT